MYAIFHSFRYSDESSQNTETSSLDEEDEPERKKKKSVHSLKDYWPPDWLKSTKQRPFPYFPQFDDKVRIQYVLSSCFSGCGLSPGGVFLSGTPAVS